MTLWPIRAGRDMSQLLIAAPHAGPAAPAGLGWAGALHIPGLPPEPRDLGNLQRQDVFGHGKP